MKDKKPAAHSSLCETQHEKGTLRFSAKEKEKKKQLCIQLISWFFRKRNSCFRQLKQVIMIFFINKISDCECEESLNI